MASFKGVIKKHHSIYISLGIICSLASLDSFSISASKKTGLEKNGLIAEVPETSQSSHQIIRLDFPVHYQITKTRILGNQANTETENYRETWTLEIHNNGSTFLQSPRMTEAVYAPRQKLKSLPQSINIGEQGFANLLGVQVFEDSQIDAESEREEDEEEIVDDAKVLSLDLVNHGTVTNLQINLSEEERLVVSLQVDLPRTL